MIMARGLACTVAAALLSVGIGCGFLQQSDSTIPVVALPEQTTGSIELPAAKEADIDPEQMTLTGKEWVWIRTTYNNDTIVVPVKPGFFSLTFNNDNTLNVKTDCNRMSGSYETDARLLTIGKLAATRMFCPDSQETVFADMLSQVSSFLFTSKGELVLELKYDSGQLLFK
jgi:heat shock protein HslJ